MAKPKARTIQQRFGFMDDDLKSASHDDIMIWLDCAIDDMLAQLVGYDDVWGLNEFEFIYQDNNYPKWGSREKPFPDKQKVFNSLFLPDKPPLVVTHKVWEQPISTETQRAGQSKYVVGFADMLITYKPAQLIYDLDSEELTIFNSYYEKRVFFEVKSFIPSLGELIRQIRMYQQYVSGEWFVVSPDNKFKNQLKTQGIGFVHCVM